jgi:FtsZ-interacting cell division protein ZipA
MQAVARILGAVAVIALLAGSAWAQKGPAKYGEEDKAKTPAEIAAEKDAERAYRRSLGNIPEQQKTDPWGTVRSESAPPKAAAKAPSAKPKAKSAEGAAKQ